MRSGEMALVDAARSLRFRDRADPEQNLDRLLPVGSIGLGIEQARIEFDVLAIVLSERQALGSFFEVANHRHSKARGTLPFERADLT